MLILKPTSKIRTSGEWSGDDHDVFSGDRHIGRVMLSRTAPQGTPWFWTITTARVPQSSVDCGYATSREEAMTAFRCAWNDPNPGDGIIRK
jgi:hypothetical protein